MNNTTNYLFVRRCWQLLVLCGLLLLGGVAQAQSGPVGNEWIVPGQRYFKLKVLKDGIYRIDYQYLTKAGITGVAPSQLQIWRRGREVAVYGGGSQAQLDATTFLEFYGQRNDGRLDGELYKTPEEQAHQYYNFYTDTSAYFITWSASRGGRRMQQPVATPATPHPHRISNALNLRTEIYYDLPVTALNFLPWVEPSEGYFSGQINMTADSVVRNLASTGPAPRIEVLVMGATGFAHHTQVSVRTPAGTLRQLGVIDFTGLRRAKQSFPILRSDIGPNGMCAIQVRPVDLNDPTDKIQIAYFRVITPQANRWFPNRNSLFFQNDSLLAGPATYELDSIPATVAGFDVQDPYNVQRVPGAAVSGGFQRRQYVFPGATSVATHTLLLADEARLAVPLLPAREVKFRTINPASPTFIIITHPRLMKPDAASGIVNAAKDYASYRKSAAGGNYDTLMVTAPQLYDQFTYGDRSWLALRHFSRWLAAANPTATKRYLLLLGKGLIPSERPLGGNGPILTSSTIRLLGEVGLDLVPTSGRSESDNLLTADFANDDFVGKLHVGRLTVTTPRQIKNYLDKLRTYESTGAAPWRKDMLHLVGGDDATESANFKLVLDRIGERVRRPFLGGRVVQTEVRTSTLVSTVDISPYLNAGLSMITYFGHGSNNTFKLDFGSPSRAASYNNPGRYPVLFLNGCAGNFTGVSTYTVVEDYLFAEQKGAIGSLGESGFGYPMPLEIAADTLTHLLFNDPNWYGKPITAVHDEMVRRLQHQPFFRDNVGIEQMLCTTWQGDPTIALYSPPLPDLIASSNTLSIVPTAGQPPVTATSANFVLNVGVSNPGKITYDPIEIRVTRTLGAQRETYPFTVRQAWRQDTTYALSIPNSSIFLGKGGSNNFKVELDYQNKIAESNESNNVAQIDFTFVTGGLTVLNPTEFAISATATPRLAVQSNNPNEASRVYEFELDTDPAFASAQKKTTTVTASVLAEWLPTLPTTVASRDSVVWFWRARFQTPAANEDGSWATSSFRVIPSSPAGWSQSHVGQFKRDVLTGIDVQGPGVQWAFSTERIPLVLRTVGGGARGSAPQFGSLLGAGIYLQSAGLPVVSNCGVQSPNLLIAVYDGNTLRPIIMPAAYQRCGQGPNYSYFFSTTASADTLDNLNNSATRQQQLDAFLTAIPNNAYVAVVSTNRLRYSRLPAALKTRLQTLLGSQLISTLADGEPLALISQKLTATTGRLLHEQGPDRTLGTLAYNQRIELKDTLVRAGTTGHVVSTQIGPSQQWNNLYASILKTNSSGQYTLKVIGIDDAGAETTVLPNVQIPGNGVLTTQSLANVPAATRYLRLDLALSDTAHVAPQLRQWLVTSRGLPEGVVQRDAVPASTYAAATLLQQATSTSTQGIVSFPVKFKNVSTETFNGPLNTRVQVRDLSDNSIRFTAPLISTPAPLPGETATIGASIDMKGLFGRFQIEVVVNPRLQNPGLQLEQNYANNELKLPEFTIINNNVPPTLDVAIDGRHILNGELVSSRPIITVQLNDEDQLRHITDASVFTVTLLRPGQTGQGALVPLTGNDVHFTVDTSKGSVARLTYEPGLNGPLPDGKYTLRVQGRDPNNSAAAAQDVQLAFEVVNATTISNVYPYPNPVISKARFVFTVTGQEAPRNMKIQIMSLTGRVVREIFASELGPLHVGNNITEYAWDGTDSYGDRLANGTYLYRVAYDSSEGFSHRDTVGDKAFKNDWGKLVLMR